MNHMYEINNLNDELPIKIYNHIYNTTFKILQIKAKYKIS